MTESYSMNPVHKRTEIIMLDFLLCKMCFLTQKTSCPDLSGEINASQPWPEKGGISNWSRNSTYI
jgi:hypothetical protein